MEGLRAPNTMKLEAVTDLDFLGCTRATLILSASPPPCPEQSGKL